MKYIRLFEEHVNEEAVAVKGFTKSIDSIETFNQLKQGQEIIYRGVRYSISKKNDETVILQNGSYTKKANFGMLKDKGLIKESVLTFTDGEKFDTSGELRTEERADGWYVLGEGKLIPVKDKVEGEEIIKKLSKK